MWGALEATGNMSGLIGQAAYGEVDFVMSGVMTTRDRFNVADSPMSFDSDYMVFVSPPPGEKNKAVAPYRVFNLYVNWETYISMKTLHNLNIIDVVNHN